jgi:hypothetical protein
LTACLIGGECGEMLHDVGRDLQEVPLVFQRNAPVRPQRPRACSELARSARKRLLRGRVAPLHAQPMHPAYSLL